MKKIIIDVNKKYKIDDVCLIAKNKAVVVVEKEVLEQVDKNFQKVKKLLNKNIYGLTTGVADLSIEKPNVSVDTFQKNILLSHAVGVGDYLSKETVRAAVFSRLIVLSKGMSGVSPELLLFLQELLNKDVVPLVPEYGSIGASDLTILAGIFVVLCNKGKVLYKNKLLSPFEAFRKAKIAYPKVLQTREGLALINGNNATIGLACILSKKIDIFIRCALKIATLSLEARGSTSAVYNRINQEVKPFIGQKRAAGMLEKILENSEQIFKTYENKNRTFLQDPPSFKTVAQIFGNIFDASDTVKNVINIELNSVSDNPIFVNTDKTIEPSSSGNYICGQLATNFDQLSLCLASIATTSLSRMKILVNEKFSEGLPSYLINDNSNNSGFMICIYSAESLLSEVKTLLYPPSSFGISVANNWEDVSTNAFNTVKNTQKIFELTEKIVFLELALAIQAQALRGEVKFSELSQRIYKTVEKFISLPITSDENVYDYMQKLNENKEDIWKLL